MASIPLLAEAPRAASAPTLAPTVAPTLVATPPPTALPTATLAVPTPSPTAVARAAAQKVDVAIRDNSFSPATVKVPVGSTVVWSQTGQRPHTVTADDESFATDVLKNGATFQQTFSKPGAYLYYCELHGGEGGVGMAARIEVEP
jgi:plastocyanin